MISINAIVPVLRDTSFYPFLSRLTKHVPMFYKQSTYNKNDREGGGCREDIHCGKVASERSKDLCGNLGVVAELQMAPVSVSYGAE